MLAAKNAVHVLPVGMHCSEALCRCARNRPSLPVAVTLQLDSGSITLQSQQELGTAQKHCVGALATDPPQVDSLPVAVSLQLGSGSFMLQSAQGKATTGAQLAVHYSKAYSFEDPGPL